MALKGVHEQLAELVAGSQPAGGEAGAENASLFVDDLPSPIYLQAESRGVEVRRGPGRPAGSRNRSSEDVVKYLNATGRHPLLALDDVVGMTWSELARARGSTLEDASEFWRKCMDMYLPYRAKKQPQAVELDLGEGRALPILAIVSAPVEPRLAEGNRPGGDGLAALNVTRWGTEAEQGVEDAAPVPLPPPVSRS